ncbi:MAG: TonB-dependent receptor [Thermonemataceae bacterium]
MKQVNKWLLNTLFLACTLAFSWLSPAYGQTGAIRGLVTDADTGEPVIGVGVGVKGTSTGAATGADGIFYIPVAPTGKITLGTTSIGYAPIEVEVEVKEGEVTKIDIQVSPSDTELDEVLITGIRRSQINAINQKRNALNNKEVITTDDIGRLPDINVAEATQRVSGVSIETDRGEGRFVQIRGIQPALNNVTLNNSNIASTSGSRATPLDLVPVEAIGSIEVAKVVMPDMEANSVGGAININTVSAFDRAEPFAIFSLDGLVQEQQAEIGDNKFPFRTALMAGKRFGKNENLGMVFSANFFRRDFSASVLDPDEWIYAAEAEGSPAYFLPNEIEIQIEDNERDRLGFTYDLDFRPTEFSSIYLRTMYTRTNERTLNSEAELTMDIGELSEQTPTSGRWDAGSAELDLSGNDEVENLYTVTLGGKNRWNNFSADLYGTFSIADRTNETTDGTFENPEDTESLLANNYDVSDFFFTVSPENPEVAQDPSIYNLRSLNFINTDVRQTSVEGSLDLRYDFNLSGKPFYVKAGGRYRRREIEQDVTRDQYGLDDGDGGEGIEAANPYTLTQFFVEPFAPVQGGTTPFVNGDPEAFIDFVSADGRANVTPDRIVFQPFESAFENIENDLNNSETVTAGYLMGVLDLGKVNAVAGFRIENTVTTSTRAISSFNDDEEAFEFRQDTDENSYTNFLPSIILMANLTDNLLLRASWTNTIGRPDYTRLSQTTEIEFEETSTEGVFEGEVQEANPDLQPFESSNFDLSLEYYFPSGGILSVGGFYKDIDNQIFEQVINFRDTLFQGRQYEELLYQRDINAEAASLIGIEFSYDQAFTFLPGFLSGLGITLNATFIDSEVTVPGREEDDLPLFRQPSNIFNIIPYYQKDGWEFRLALAYRGDFLTQAALPTNYEGEIGLGATIADFDRYEAERTTLDITGAYNFADRKVRVWAQARNVTNAAEEAYQGIESRYDRHDLVGRTYFLGFSLNF